jgi:hypothetical protein
MQITAVGSDIYFSDQDEYAYIDPGAVQLPTRLWKWSTAWVPGSDSAELVTSLSRTDFGIASLTPVGSSFFFEFDSSIGNGQYNGHEGWWQATDMPGQPVRITPPGLRVLENFNYYTSSWGPSPDNASVINSTLYFLDI